MTPRPCLSLYCAAVFVREAAGEERHDDRCRGYEGRCHVFTQPKKGEYVSGLKVAFGGELDLTDTVVGLTLSTDEFPRE